MSRSSSLLSAIVGLLTPRRRASRPTYARRPMSPAEDAGSTTMEVDPRRLGPVRLEWVPSANGAPDPGEIVWTWVPYEENDGRGKDRPVLVLAAGTDGSALAVQLTSKPHAGDADYVSIGTGPWDVERRESWVKLDRVFRVASGSMRREASSLDEPSFRRVAGSLATRYAWALG